MNFPATAPERARILAPFPGGEPGFRDSWEVLHPGKPHTPTVGIHPVDFVKQPECFDFVFVTEGLAGRLKAHGTNAATAASDHQPVWVQLSWGWHRKAWRKAGLIAPTLCRRLVLKRKQKNTTRCFIRCRVF